MSFLVPGRSQYLIDQIKLNTSYGSSLFAMGRSIIFIVENGLFSLVRVLSKLIQYPRFEFRIANRTAFESYTAIISKSLDGGASSIPL